MGTDLCNAQSAFCSDANISFGMINIKHGDMFCPALVIRQVCFCTFLLKNFW